MDKETEVFPVRRLSIRKSKPTMADLVDRHRLGHVPAINSYWNAASPSSSSSFQNSRPGSNNHNTSSHLVLSNNLASVSDSESGSDLKNEDPISSLSSSEEDEDDLPLTHLCRRVNRHISIDNGNTSPALCAASDCADPVSQTDERLGGRYCSVECLIRACRQAFHDAFPEVAMDDQGERLDDRMALELASPTAFTNPEGLVS